MDTLDTLAYKTADMPQHLDSVMAIVFSTLLSPSILAKIMGHLESLENPDFEIANGGYLAIRNEKKRGHIIDYAIAANHWQALAQLQKAMEVKTRQKSGLIGIGFGIFPLMQRALNFTGLKWIGGFTKTGWL